MSNVQQPELTQAEQAFADKIARMSEWQRKAYFNKLSMRQEEECVKQEKAHGNLAYRIAKEFDVIVFPKCGGEVWLIDCKFSNNHEFNIDGSDIIKIFDVASKMKDRLPGIIIKCKFDMWFPRTRQKNNRRYIDVNWDDVGWSIRCTKTPVKITTQRVCIGRQDEREDG